MSFQLGAIYLGQGSFLAGTILTSKTYNLTPYNKLNVQAHLYIVVYTEKGFMWGVTVRNNTSSFDFTAKVGSPKYTSSTTVDITLSVDISNIHVTSDLQISVGRYDSSYTTASSAEGQIYRIWLS